MEKTNLLYVITKLELGGAQKQLLSLIRNLDKEKFNIFLFTHRHGLLMEEAEAISGLKIKKSYFLESPINPLMDFPALLEITNYIEENNIDIVHTHSSKAGILGRLAARLSGVKIIIHSVHGWSFNDFQHRFKRSLFIALEKFCANFTDRLIVVSESDREKGLKNKIGREKMYSLVRYGINYDDFSIKYEDIKQEFGISDNELVVGTISCFKPQKAVTDLIKAAALVVKDFANVKFVIVGDGVLRRKIEEDIKRLQLKGKVILAGWRQDANRILSALDVFVLTSLWEGLPISVLEAVASSCPVVATDTGGVSEIIIDQDSGFLVSVRDMPAMAQRITSLLKDKDLRQAMGNKARSLLGNNYTTQNLVDKTQKLYEGLIKDKL